ncbi:helix-turn-helix domain-containing protein [Vibrio parahaemolyticus]|nr:helix-turn-helix domain-containing protein [Vibrio parahaemolyticus]EJG0752964.1 helix-turn-helix domain-containing protein [Vibrio parahaemolyticus]EJG1065887.1 helix-turn-helix domain-containing protein [Vibrio parahaemolyticus O1]ELA9875586.1 helix-turn-helix domain-containing protein [Vibrio parahaemolyticus]
MQIKMRLLALAHFKDGYSHTQIVKFLKVSRTSGNNWVQTFLEEGLEGWQEKPSTGGFEKSKSKRSLRSQNI